MPSPESTESTPQKITLPISAADVLDDARSARRVVEDEIAHGNSDLIRGLHLGGIAGPFRSVTPWELCDERGILRINAGGYAASPFGDRYPPLLEFVQDFLAKSDAMWLAQQSASPWRAALEANLVALLARFAPSHADSRVFFSNSGAEAVEAALKFARAARPNAPLWINFQRAYHGKTSGALALTPNPEYQDPFRPLMPGVVTLPFGDLKAFERAVRKQGAKRIAAVFLEPIQGEAGVHLPPAGFLSGVGEVCRRHGILIVADEIQTGLGRCGHWFASLAAGLEPDIVTLAKPLGGGLVPIGATIARRAICERMLGGLHAKRHSNTFGGGALAMAVGLKSLEILAEERLPERAARLGEIGLARLQAVQSRYPKLLHSVRGAGLLLALQFHPVLPNVPFAGEMIGELSGILGLLALHRAGVQANFSLSARATVRLTPALNMPEDLFTSLFDRIDRMARDNPSGARLLTNTPGNTLLNLVRFAV